MESSTFDRPKRRFENVPVDADTDGVMRAKEIFAVTAGAAIIAAVILALLGEPLGVKFALAMIAFACTLGFAVLNRDRT